MGSMSLEALTDRLNINLKRQQNMKLFFEVSGGQGSDYLSAVHPPPNP